MAVDCKCPKCGEVLYSEFLNIRDTVKCPYCDNRFQIQESDVLVPGEDSGQRSRDILRQRPATGSDEESSVIQATPTNGAAMSKQVRFLVTIAWANAMIGVIAGIVLIVVGIDYREWSDSAFRIENPILTGLGVGIIWESILVLAFLLVVSEISFYLRQVRDLVKCNPTT